MFEPLLLEECAAQMLRGQEEGQVLTSQVRPLLLSGTRMGGRQGGGGGPPACRRLEAPVLHPAHACGHAPGRCEPPLTCHALPTRLQPAVVAAAAPRASGDGSLVVRLTLPPGVSSTFHENDMLLLSRDNPEARGVGRELLLLQWRLRLWDSWLPRRRGTPEQTLAALCTTMHGP